MKMTTTLALVLFSSCSLLSAQQFRVIYSFAGSQLGDGQYPFAGLISDVAGNLYGTTRSGGFSSSCIYALGCGTVFQLSANSDGSWSESVIYSFCSDQVNSFCLDGAFPEAGLFLDSKGNLYGTTKGGGSQAGCFTGLGGCGAVYELSPPAVPGGSWTETVLYNFCSASNNGASCTDGYSPTSQLISDEDGNLFGTTSEGGSGHKGNAVSGGTVFELSPGATGWSEVVLYDFCSVLKDNLCSDGQSPQAGLALDELGNLYGTTESGGGGGGTVFVLSRGSNGWSEKVIESFYRSVGGNTPLGSVSLDALGNLYSTTSSGGSGYGTVFKLNGKRATSHTFSFDGTNGAAPAAGVLIDASRKVLYGTSSGGGYESGNIFEVDALGQETSLYTFCQQSNCSDGYGSYAGLIKDSSGNLYGTTAYGGLNNQGIVFELIP